MTLNYARSHCGYLMRHERIVMRSGNTHNHYACAHCGYREREVRTRSGSLISWRNLSRLAREASARV